MSDSLSFDEVVSEVATGVAKHRVSEQDTEAILTAWNSLSDGDDEEDGAKNVSRRKQQTHSSRRSFDSKILSAHEIRSEFTARPCCEKNCVEAIFQMPLDPYTRRCFLGGRDGGRCVCSSKEPIVCAPIISDIERETQQKKAAAFEHFVQIVRDTTKDYRRDDKALTNYLITKFEEKRYETSKGKTQWAYDLMHPTLGLISCCRSAFMAVFGVTKGKLEWVQGRVRKCVAGLVSHQESLDGRNGKPKTMKEIFGTFGLDLDVYRDHITNWLDFSAVSDSPETLVATAWLSDYIELDGEFQV